jgi:puromycin-sensitive aminopeptidase
MATGEARHLAAKKRGARRTRAPGSPRKRAKASKTRKASSGGARKGVARKKSRATSPPTKTGRERAASRAKPAAKRRSPARARKKASRAARSPEAFRLAPDVRPVAMDLHVEVDPGKSSRYGGDVAFTLQLGQDRRTIELHACELRVSRAVVRTEGRRLAGRVVPHPERETVEIVLDEPAPAGHARLELRFSARLRDDLCGLYGVEVDGRRFAFSQLAATHARRFVPCFDEPGMKTRFRLAVTTGARNQVVSNSPIEAEEILADGRKTVHFSATPPLSSYLLALAVGELAQSRVVECGPTPISVWHVPGREGLSDFALDVARDALARLEDWFGLAHPYAKLDLVAVPEFQFGAMENAGAVFFRETLLLVDPATASLAEQKRAAEVITHELAHMWYGNLVTMAWWDDLWLNEAFATWMAFEILESARPDWRVWQTFQHRRAAALDADALDNTHAVHTPVATADEAAENFDLITYEKGASVLRMLAGHLGAEVFRDGVRLYVRRHRESNAVAADLWNALGEASGERVDRLVRPWLEEEGHPVVHVARREKDGLGIVELRQERMRMAPAPRRRKVPARRPRWPIPMLGRIQAGPSGRTRTVRHLLTRLRERIPAQGADLTFMYANARESGFYRPHHAPDLLEDLIADVESLEPIERQGLVDHQWALVRSGHAELPGLLDLAARLGNDHDPDVLAAVAVPLLSLCKRLAPDAAPESESRLRAWVEVYFGGQVDDLGWAPAPGEDARTGLRRAEVLRIVGVIGEASEVLEEASLRCLQYLQDRRALASDLADPIVTMAAMRGGPPLHAAFLDAMRAAETPQEQRRFLLALADFEQPELVDRTLALCVGDEVAAQDLVFVLMRLLENRHARERTWAFVRRRWSTLRRHLPPQLGIRLIGATPALLTRTHRDEVADFFGTHPLPSSERALRQAIERFDWYAGFRRRVAPQLTAYLGT